jgi:5-formyltetrahydrofolate cyclo-ligase
MKSSDKISIRKTGLARRQALSPQQRIASSLACAERLAAFIESLGKAPLTIGGYAPTKSEMDILLALAALATRHVTALPAMVKGSRILSFRRFVPGDELVTGAYDIREPSPEAETVTPGIIVVPLVAFDRNGSRLGYGGGYYDTTLGSFGDSIIAVGAAFSSQEVDAIPVESFDVRMHAVVTEKETIRIT